MTTIPQPGTQINIAGIPAELRAIEQWVLWKPVKAGNKVMKVPVAWYAPEAGNADAQDMRNWTTFETVIAAVQRDPRYGIGLCLRGTRLICIDYDNHAGDDPAAVALGAEYFDMLLRELPTYAEYSVSGLGRHAFVRGVLPHGRVTGELDPLNWEIYSQQFIAITGYLVPGSVGTLADGQHMIDSWNLPEPVIGAGAVPVTQDLYRCLVLTDSEVIQTMMARRATVFAIMNDSKDMTDRSTQFKQIIGDLDKITGNPDQIDRIIRKAPFFGNSYNREKYEQSPKWLARDGHANMLEYWLKQARADNTESIPYMPPLTAERRAELEACLERSRTVQAETERLHAGVLTQEEEQELEPIDLLGRFSPPTIPAHAVPKAIYDFAVQEGELMGCDPAGLVLGGIFATAVATSDSLRVKVKRNDPDWHETPRFWCQLVGEPSTKKTPIMKRCMKPLRSIEIQYAKENMERMDKFNARENPKQTDQPPAMRRLMMQDATPEAVQDVMKGNPHGIAVFRDELAGWMNFDRYKEGGGDTSPERTFWLESYDGGPSNVDRIKRGQMYIPNASAAVFGGIQPEKIRNIAAKSVDDGLMQRFMTVVLKPADIQDRDLPVGRAYAEYKTLVDRLHKMTGEHVEGGSHDGGAVFQLSDGAAKARQQYFNMYGAFAATELINKKLASHVGKYNGMLMRLSLLYHMIKWAHLVNTGTKIPMYIDAATVDEAHAFIWDFVFRHSLALYAGVLSLVDEDTTEAAKLILVRGADTITVADIRRGMRNKESFATRDIEVIMERLDALGWALRLDKGERRNSQMVMYVNPKVHVKFKVHAEAERETRKTSQRSYFEALEKHKQGEVV